MNGSEMNGSKIFGQKAIFVGNARKILKKAFKLSFLSYSGAIFSSTLDQIVKMKQMGTLIFER